jgi:high-affinity nickel-transport protein
MERVVGVTLIVLGTYVVYSLLRYRSDFRMRSRWMLIISGTRKAVHWVRQRIGSAAGREVLHDHEHVAVPAYHHAGGEGSADEHTGTTHSHVHTHRDADADYTNATSLGVGALHGVGAETPTQVVVFLAAANAGGAIAGIGVLVVFLIGLMLANTAITLTASFGFLAAGRSQRVYMTMGAITGTASLVLGFLFLFGVSSVLPAFFAG